MAQMFYLKPVSCCWYFIDIAFLLFLLCPISERTQEHLTLITGMSHVSRNVNTKELETSDRCH